MRISKGDALVAGGALAGIVSGTYGGLSSSGPWERDLDVLGLCLIAVASLALAFRRAAPVSVGAVTIAAAVAYHARHYPGVFAAAPALAAVYTAAAQGRRRPAIALAAGFGAIACTLVALSDVDPQPGDGFNLLSGWLVAMVVAGEVVRSRRAYLREVESRAVEAERTKEEAALRRVGEERLWIAQELHDALTHTISVMNVQAAVARQYLDRDPVRARRALAAVRESGAEAMSELRSTLQVLRTDTTGPDAGLACLPRLLGRAEAAGLHVAASVVGERYDLPAEVDRAAYRIVQEAFTNTLRHAGAASVTLTTEYRPHSVVVRVEDDGAAGADPPAGPGMGLIGMRERAVAVGGTLAAGPRVGGGFAVRAELPVPVPA
ncbi:sensor histidine kinase [Actinomadura sp. WAC 06369]|uniref:sensor histidine kinase n=1 Tax=Actinomadura sp. WAC 06369 TaxID=2203193 RepID=UPI000F77D440|nr:histidine kinase [Actinomadura sp. WAC 06369]